MECCERLLELAKSVVAEASTPDDERAMASCVVRLIRENRELQTVVMNYKAIVPPLKHFHDQVVTVLGPFAKPVMTAAEEERAVREVRRLARLLNIPPIPSVV